MNESSPVYSCGHRHKKYFISKMCGWNTVHGGTSMVSHEGHADAVSYTICMITDFNYFGLLLHAIFFFPFRLQAVQYFLRIKIMMPNKSKKLIDIFNYFFTTYNPCLARKERAGGGSLQGVFAVIWPHWRKTHSPNLTNTHNISQAYIKQNTEKQTNI